MRQNKTWVVTGASGVFAGILIRRLLEKGHNVAAISRTPEKVEGCPDAPGTLFAIEGAVQDEDSIKAAKEKALEKFGSVDVVINTAGYGLLGAIEEVSDKEAREIYDVNIFGLVNVYRNFIGYFRERGEGLLINLSCIDAIRSEIYNAVYHSTKYATDAVHEALNKEARQLGVAAICVKCGYMRTGYLTRKKQAEKELDVYDDIRKQAVEADQAMLGHEPADPEKVADLLISLSAEDDVPGNLYLTEEAVREGREKMKAIEDEYDEWRWASDGVDFPVAESYHGERAYYIVDEPASLPEGISLDPVGEADIPEERRKSEQEKVWIVTGASGGLGLAVVKTLLAHNVRVAAFSRSAERVQEAVGLTETDRFMALSVKLHVEQEVIDAKQKVLDKFGRVDVVVNNAGHGQRGGFEEVSDFELRRVYDDDVFSQLNMLRHFIPVLRAEGGGYFINLGSVGSFKSKPCSGAYCSAKYAVDALTVAVNKECAGFNIKATCVKPFDVRTNYLSKAHLDKPANPIPCYASIHEEHRIDDEETHGAQPGDPMRVGELFVELAERDHVPESLFLDYPAKWLIDLIHTERGTEMDKWEHLAKTVEY